MVHFEHTGVEILEQVNGSIDGFCSGVGTGGTISGIGRLLKNIIQVLQYGLLSRKMQQY